MRIFARSLFIGTILTSALAGGAVGNTIPSGDVRALAEKFQESKQTIAASEAEKRRILGSLYDINKRMKKITKEKGHLTDELFQVQMSVEALAKVIAGLESQIDQQRRLLRTRLRTLYKLSGEGYLSLIFSATSSHELDKSMKFLKIMTDSDYRLIRSYQQNVVTYRVQRGRLKGQVKKLVQIESRIRKQENLLVKEHNAKSQIASELESSKKKALLKIKSIRQRTPALNEDDETLAGLLKPSFFEKKGLILHPVEGVIAQDFGLVSGDGDQVKLSHKGRQYRAPAGTPVISVFDGTIVFADWISGYGNTLIVDHGDHYYSVYGHVVKPRFKIGESVTRGQTIAEAGASSRRYGDGIYFEIRHFSEPENPKAWLEKKSLPIAGSGEGTEESVELATIREMGTK